jgi:hypothetical protein
MGSVGGQDVEEAVAEMVAVLRPYEEADWKARRDLEGHARVSEWVWRAALP